MAEGRASLAADLKPFLEACRRFNLAMGRAVIQWAEARAKAADWRKS